MKELKVILIITLFLIIGGIITVRFYSSYEFGSDFNFYKSEIMIVNSTQIKETLHYIPDKSYHTLFRNFADPILLNDSSGKNHISIFTVDCSNGYPYFKTFYGICYNGSIEIPCLSYTEPNEYGCTFGSDYGFFDNNEYTVSSTYEINAENIFLINGEKYIKFVVYSPKNHYKLTANNFIVSTQQKIVKKAVYQQNENVIVYIPYSGQMDGKQLFALDDFEFDYAQEKEWLFYIIFFVPAFLFFFTWMIFGRENFEKDMPEQLSMMPDEMNKRKPWQVAAYFNPPFSLFDKNSLSATLLDFYHKKIIDIKLIGQDTFVKTNGSHGYSLDKVEAMVFNLLRLVETKSREKYKNKGYVNLSSVSKDVFNLELKSGLMAKAKILQKEVANESKEFISTIGVSITTVITLVFVWGSSFLGIFYMIPLLLFALILVLILNTKTAIFSKHRKYFYTEYKHWQAFRKYLNNSFSIRNGTYKAIVMWDDYLVYSTALGVSKKVIKELRSNNIISAQQEKLYIGTYSASAALRISSGAGGHGGAGSGGTGGGGGGGR